MVAPDASESAGALVLSLDLEMMWGVRHRATKAEYGHRVLGERKAIPRMLELFERNGLHATWAVVGFAMCDGRDDLLSRLPEDRPSYADSGQSAYSYIAETGSSEREDPFYFGPSLVRQIIECPNQEIASHTFSHYCCLEPGQTKAQFRADLQAAIAQLGEWGRPCNSIVFPRHQYSPTHLKICSSLGIEAFRGNEDSWLYRSGERWHHSQLRRAGRLIDTYLPISGHNISRPNGAEGIVNIPSSRFLRPYSRKLRRLEPLRLQRIKHAMTRAAREKSIFHLWWHPHNFGTDLPENMQILRRITAHFKALSDEYGMRSFCMAEAAQS